MSRNTTRLTEQVSTRQYHVSHLLKTLEDEMGKAVGVKRRYGDDDPSLRFEMGYVMEDLIGETIFRNDPHRADTVIPLGTLERDGILATPDDYDCDTGEPIELKATWSSSKRPIGERWYWLGQVKSYCHILGSLSAVFRVFYICGDWAPPAPDVQMYRVYFTEQEVEETWRMLVRQRERLVEREQ